MWFLSISLFLATFRFNVITGAIEDLCYSIEEERVWTNGVKSMLNIQLDKEYDSWEVTFVFDAEVDSFHAWKGDLTTINQTTFSAKSTCYNQHLYACQILPIGYVLKYLPENSPDFQPYLNGVLVPPAI
eukprot:TRINITY_DN5111_c0_g1_i7.p1 TRINITY_DN5111_c0_g1~~TRINITY_DN5111_c0_g1_i7.p1  ORF type:complete len:129 (-),score=21.59 TRINITY_DN5111_c0_g1_i7:67-453(-)